MTTKIFVGSLPSGCKPEELRRLFEDFGIVTECDVMNRCGFVHMENSEMATNAIKALNATQFKGQSINVEPGRLRDRDQKPPNGNGGGGGGNRNRGRMNRGGGPRGLDFNNDSNATTDALQLCSAVFEEMNKLLKPNVNQGRQQRGGNGHPKAIGGMDGPGNRNGRSRDRNNSGNRPAIQNRGNAGRMQGNSGNINQGSGGRNQSRDNPGPIRNERSAPHQSTSPYNRGGTGGGRSGVSDAPIIINFVDEVQSAQNFAKSLSSSVEQIDNKWPNNASAPVPLMNRNFNDDMPVTGFNSSPRNNQQRFGNSGNFGGNGNQGGGFGNRGGNFGNNPNSGGNNDRPQGGNFGAGNQERRGGSFQNSNDRFQNGNSFGLGNQDRRGFALPERQTFNDRNGPGNQGFSGGGNRSFGNNFSQDGRGMGGGGGNQGGSSNFNNRRNNNSGNFDGGNLNNNRQFSNTTDFNRNSSFGGNNLNSNNPGFNRNTPRAGGNSLMSRGNNRFQGVGDGRGNENSANRGNQGGMNPLNFQNDFPPLVVSGGGPNNNNNRNGPRQNMMSNRRY